MEELCEAKVTKYIPTIYTTPCSMEYTQNGCRKKWDLFATPEGVIILIYNATRDVLVLVKQFRPALYVHEIPECDRKSIIDVRKYTAHNAITLELCAGTADKNLPIEVIAQEEVFEECGYEVSLNDLEKVCTFVQGEDTNGAKLTLFYCEVTDDMKVNAGGGVDGEIIEIVDMKVSDVLEYIKGDDVKSPPNTLFGIYWFLENKYKDKMKDQ